MRQSDNSDEFANKAQKSVLQKFKILSASTNAAVKATQKTGESTRAVNIVKGRVTDIIDGETLVIKNKLLLKVRISGIDAPDDEQPYWKQAKQTLSKLCYQKAAEVQYVGIDDKATIIADVTCKGKDPGAAMLKQGMAWMHINYSSKYHTYAANLEKAQKGKLGLWVDSKPIPPWEWRKAKNR